MAYPDGEGIDNFPSKHTVEQNVRNITLKSLWVPKLRLLDKTIQIIIEMNLYRFSCIKFVLSIIYLERILPINILLLPYEITLRSMYRQVGTQGMKE